MNDIHLRQTEAAECGLACLAIAADMLGSKLDLADLRRLHPVSPRGLSFSDIANIAGSMNMVARAVHCELDELSQLTCPAILHWGLNHFVVLVSVDRNRVVIRDPAAGRRVETLERVSQRFTGMAMEIAAAPAFTRKTERSRLKLTSLFRWTPSLSGGMLQALLLSLLLQAYIIASPFYMQLAVDEGAMKGDGELLMALAVGFGLFALFNMGAEALRGLALQRVSALLGWDMTQRLFHHLVRLPLVWFQRRRLADAMTRFDSLTPVKNLIANGLIGALIDGVLSSVTLVMMFFVAPSLAWIVMAGLGLYIVLRLVTIPWTIKLGSAALSASIAEQGKRIETLRAMQTIKVMAAETEREGDWSNKLAATIRTNQAAAVAQVSVTAVQTGLDGLSLVLIIFLGAKNVIAGEMTIGMLYAFLAYRMQFLRAAQSVFEQYTSARLLDIHTHRLADIALHPVETGIDRSPTDNREIRGGIELRNVAFAYAPHEPPILRGINIRIEPGEFVAIVGPSGTGKSTLLKVMTGLFPVSAGEVSLDGLPLSSWGPKAVRRNLGVVMQDDELLAGSIAENVAFFAEDIDMDRVWKCLKAASFEGEVMAMPMRAETMVGDMGSSLSGGQKQRVLLARALYRTPRILVLDEATSHLDLGRERAINIALKSLSITRVIVAHRKETIAAADRVIQLDGGTVVADFKQGGAASPEAPALPIDLSQLRVVEKP
ncbi:peptidase domain-containing ABC transporter [Caulobacter endophyticus]|uniref:peptidase domain-containing ABC transporter n=1 Tax=Caulobacter endophyticus TaxID=2172652 RepID=UPI00240F207A|nr:peptidase domain-containing ABC transporter [Caulobacter endophyticus]MDG2528909.1 peptidase domain-containing ABC transporter [Caulobacter endophyticus]